MALAGCTGVFVGLESLEDANLADARKKTPSAADYLRRVTLFHEHGIQVNGSFVLGFDHDRPEVFERTVDWIERARLECATFHILTPYPGTPLFRQMESEGRLLHRDWSLYDTSHVVFRPARMTPEHAEATRGATSALLHASTRRRRPRNRARCPVPRCPTASARGRCGAPHPPRLDRGRLASRRRGDAPEAPALLERSRRMEGVGGRCPRRARTRARRSSAEELPRPSARRSFSVSQP
jgi:hypothetical protein